ncbi:hypothetical protein PsYK624_030780 [Phanerochaete sordida]|uniref:Uncharacterized protein n=1 Tax=Phanerochaete sordida TaxID=48140 RepID=A0A9P3L9C4_9APHY|nr:hypothetical protein PsYK624_030780 [Phanerochaete sordida]
MTLSLRRPEKLCFASGDHSQAIRPRLACCCGHSGPRIEAVFALNRRWLSCVLVGVEICGARAFGVVRTWRMPAPSARTTPLPPAHGRGDAPLARRRRPTTNNPPHVPLTRRASRESTTAGLYEPPLLSNPSMSDCGGGSARLGEGGSKEG